VRTVPVPHWNYRLTPHSPNDTHRRRLANELDKNVLFMRMLEAAGVPCSLALVRDRGSGPVVEEVPCLMALDRSAVLLEESGEYVTAVSDLLPFGVLPGSIQDAPALPIKADGAELTRTQRPPLEEETDETLFTAKLDAEGNLAIELMYAGTGNAQAWLRNLKDADKQRLDTYMQQIAGGLHPAAVLKDYEKTDLAALDVPARITLHCEIPGYAVKAGEELMLFDLPAIQYTAGEVGRPTRTYPMHWDQAHRETARGTLVLPRGYTVYSIPEDVDFDSDVASYAAHLEARNGTLTFVDMYTLKVAEAPAAAYSEYKQCKELRASLPRQRIILTRRK